LGYPATRPARTLFGSFTGGCRSRAQRATPPLPRMLIIPVRSRDAPCPGESGAPAQVSGARQWPDACPGPNHGPSPVRFHCAGHQRAEGRSGRQLAFQVARAGGIRMRFWGTRPMRARNDAVRPHARVRVCTDSPSLRAMGVRLVSPPWRHGRYHSAGRAGPVGVPIFARFEGEPSVC